MSLRSPLVIACALLLWYVDAAPKTWGQTPSARKPPASDLNGEWPEPPQTGRPWRPSDSRLPQTWVRAIELLLAHGLADPRGCEYREVEVTCGSVWSKRGIAVATHAWLLPLEAEAAPDAPRFAVTWSGLVYPVEKVGAAANLAADVEKLLKTQPAGWRRAMPEKKLVSHEQPHPLKGVLLFLLGDAPRAEAMWKVAPPHAEDWLKGPENRNDDPYPELVHEWSWAHFDRAVCARLRGDDVVSLMSAKLLVALRDVIEQESLRHGFIRRKDIQGRPMMLLGFLDSIDALAKDEARRLAEPPVERVLSPDSAPIPDQNARISALIRDLEVVNETQMAQPGGISLAQSPVILALVKEGDAAVEPLLECLANDQRLTRSVWFGRDFQPNRTFITVEWAAFETLQAILKTRTFGPLTERGSLRGLPRPDNETRRAFVKEVRDFWNKTKTHGDAERWYATLADSQGTERQWLDAARSITQMAPEKRTKTLDKDFKNSPRLLGEALRDGRNPSVSQLLAQRAEELTRLDLDSTLQIHHLNAACELTFCLARWEPDAALPEIRRRVEQCRAFGNQPSCAGYAHDLDARMIQLILTAVDAGHAELLDEYVAWVKERIANGVDLNGDYAMFRPLSRYAEMPKMARLAQEAFSDEAPWLPLHERLGLRGFDLVASPLVAVPAFRELLHKQLKDRTLLGTATFDPEQASVNLRLSIGVEGRGAFAPVDAEQVHLTPQPVRVCDLTAWRLSFLQGAPVFRPDWPEQQRNATILGVSQFIDHWGNAFRDRAPPSRPFIDPFRHATFHLEKLEQVGTKDDVAAGRAVFSLTDTASTVRKVALPELPVQARWKTLRSFPVVALGANDPETGKPVLRRSFDQKGEIWQAEEVLIDGRWQRFYGFVGSHIIAKVPAAEIEF